MMVIVETINSHKYIINMDTLVFWIFVMLFVVSSCQYPKSRENNYPKFPNYRETKIVKQESNIGLPNYNFSYETSDGSRREEAAVLKDTGNKKEAVLAVSGSYTYVGTDGVTYKITYVADENGYRASGEHLPTNKQ